MIFFLFCFPGLILPCKSVCRLPSAPPGEPLRCQKSPLIISKVNPAPCWNSLNQLAGHRGRLGSILSAFLTILPRLWEAGRIGRTSFTRPLFSLLSPVCTSLASATSLLPNPALCKHTTLRLRKMENDYKLIVRTYVWNRVSSFFPLRPPTRPFPLRI